MKKRKTDAGAKEVARFTVHLFGRDLERMGELRDYLRTLGTEEVNRSLLVKIALRGVSLTPALKKHVDAIREEDGRRVRHMRRREK